MNLKLGLTVALLALLMLAPAPSGPAGSASAMAQRKKSAPARAKKTAALAYSCPMHPEVRAGRAGRCPKCGMNLREVKESADSPATSGGTGESSAKEERPATTNSPPRIPDVSVYDQDNRRLNFYTDLVKGKTVAINFIFTTCTTICPPLTATFRRVQQQLGERVGRDIHLISVSVDPTTDVPERLKGFAAKFQAAPGWTFVTGSKPEIDSLLTALGAAAANKNDHTPMILVGNDPAGRWTRTYGLAPPSTLVKVINEAASAPATQGGPAREGTDAAKPKSLAEASAAYFPNVELLTQDNKPVRFYDDLLKGKVVLINFMFATCQGVCPPMTANLAKVQKYLGERVGKDVLMISISVDPTVDTPAALKKYADSFKAQPGWYFLTGKKENVDWVLYKVGGYVEDKTQHSGVLIIGNEATGEWVKMLAMAPPASIADSVLGLLKPEAK